jgi:hypothetical protein
MRLLCLAAIGVILSSPSLARGPSDREAQECISEQDHGLVAGYQQQEVNGRVVNTVDACSAYFRLELAEVTDVSQAQNMADVKVNLRYTVTKESSNGIRERCIGPPKQAASDSDRIPIGSVILVENRKISMQRWTSGWHCKGN